MSWSDDKHSSLFYRSVKDKEKIHNIATRSLGKILILPANIRLVSKWEKWKNPLAYWSEINYSRKKFFITGANVIKLFTIVSYNFL